MINISASALSTGVIPNSRLDAELREWSGVSTGQYYNASVSEVRYVNVTGDSMNGALTINGEVNISSNLTITGTNLTVCGTVAASDMNIGVSNTISGNAIGTGGFVQGTNCTASGKCAHAEGEHTTASGYSSHAEGEFTHALGLDGAHAEGLNTTVSGDVGAHAEGYCTTASGDFGAHAEGDSATASGSFGAHAEGSCTTASGETSHAAGAYALAEHARTYVWSDGGADGTNIISSTKSRQFTVHASNGIRLLGGPTEISELVPAGDLAMGIYTNHP